MRSSSDRIETLKVKAALVAYFRFKKLHNIVCCEFSYGSSDVMSISRNGKYIYECEVKVSNSDMHREIKKYKHIFKLQPATSWPWRYFYFAVPEYLATKADTFVRENFPLAGLYMINEGNFSAYDPIGVKTVIKAKPVNIGNLVHHKDLKEDAIKGMANNIVSVYGKLVDAERKLLPIKMNLE